MDATPVFLSCYVVVGEATDAFAASPLVQAVMEARFHTSCGARDDGDGMKTSHTVAQRAH